MKINKAAFKKIKETPLPQRRRVRLLVTIDVEGTCSDEEAAKLIRDTLIVDCWVGDVIEEAVVDTKVINRPE